MQVAKCYTLQNVRSLCNLDGLKYTIKRQHKGILLEIDLETVFRGLTSRDDQLQW